MDDFILESQTQYLPDNSHALYVCTQGILNKATSYRFEQFFKSILAEQKTGRVVLAFSNLSSIDSTGLGLLANFQEQFDKHDIQLKLVGVPPKVYHLFEMLGMASYFEIFDTKEEAFASFLHQKSRKELANYEKRSLSAKNTAKMGETQQRRAVVRTIKVKKERRNKNTRVLKAVDKQERQKPLIIQIEYHQKMTTFRNFPLQVTLSSRGKSSQEEDEKQYLEISPQIPGCLVIPSSICLEESEFQQVFFSITPIVPFNGKNSEIVISKNRIPMRQLSMSLTVVSTAIPKICLFLGLLGFAVFCSPGIAAWLIRDSIAAVSSAELVNIVDALEGGYWWGFALLFLFSGLAVAIQYYSRPYKAEPLVYIWEQ